MQHCWEFAPRRTDTIVFTRFSDDSNRSTVLSMNGAHKMIILNHRREMDGLVDLKFARRGQLGIASSCANLRMSCRWKIQFSYINVLVFLLRMMLQSCNDLMIKQQLRLCSKVLVKVHESVRFLHWTTHECQPSVRMKWLMVGEVWVVISYEI